MTRPISVFVIVTMLAAVPSIAAQQAAKKSPLRIALVKQPFVPNGTSAGPDDDGRRRHPGGARDSWARRSRGRRSRLTPEQDTEYGGWKRLGFALGHLGRVVAANERDGLLHASACSARARRCRAWSRAFSTPGRRLKPLRIGMLWLDAHPDFNTPETTRSGSLGGMPVAVATGRCLQRHAARRRTRSAARRSARGHGRRAADRSAGAAPARPVGASSSSASRILRTHVARGRRAARSAEPRSPTRSTSTSTWTCSTRAR